MTGGPLQTWLDILPGQIEHALYGRKHGDLQRWQEAVAGLPEATPSSCDFNQQRIRVGTPTDADETMHEKIRAQLKQLSPWRKGPYELFGIHIDSEWRSDRKWGRIKGFLQPLQGRTILDVGGGNGYHCWRMMGAGAGLVINVDPSRLFLMQYEAMRHYLGDRGVYSLPLGIDDVPRNLKAFDSVFSMGVLYHRKSPIEHILHLRECLRPGGELVLETLVVDGDENTVLLPQGRYAQMNNVWFLPSCGMLEKWLKRAGMRDIRVVDVTATTTDEQRSTEWMQFQSLPDFLDSDDPSKTIEGHPAPERAVVLATCPD
ncbi:MAG TPA: tRNA 5-methoxyuridine(34)/uridine 5-oxyacetic acid(34) synthase CmoB [Gammaproteobacteria bacterium]|nr:tRNA 5-methoxyuridine(34)/uridine 5-oxyacetic acid(34) synthase CmoB [Gammaproteobacteria bacterium]